MKGPALAVISLPQNIVPFHIDLQMAFFSKDVTNLTPDDLAKLLVDGTFENVRLELKSQLPGPEETLKKLSGLANTYGRYLIVGASENNARLADFPGVAPQSNYRLTIIQRCYEGVWPPFEVFVSDEIPTLGNTNKCLDQTDLPHGTAPSARAIQQAGKPLTSLLSGS